MDYAPCVGYTSAVMGSTSIQRTVQYLFSAVLRAVFTFFNDCFLPGLDLLPSVQYLLCSTGDAAVWVQHRGHQCPGRGKYILTFYTCIYVEISCLYFLNMLGFEVFKKIHFCCWMIFKATFLCKNVQCISIINLKW